MNIIFVAIFGAIIGSFVAVLAFRVPKNLPIVFSRSACEICGKEIKIIHNIPIVSFLLLGGKCAYCKEKIAPINFFIEIFTAVIFVLLYLKAGLSLYFLFLALSFSMLLALSIIDFKTMQAPDSINFLALFFALVASYFNGIDTFLQNAYAALILAGSFALLRLFIGFVKQEEALGEADIIVAATLGAMLGVFAAYKALFFGSIIALPIAIYLKYKHINKLPFIPFLSIGAFLAMVFE